MSVVLLLYDAVLFYDESWWVMGAFDKLYFLSDQYN